MLTGARARQSPPRRLGRAVAVVLLALGAGSPGVAAAPPDVRPLYVRHCADCHGREGRGDGPAAGLLSPRPRDFAAGIYKFRSTPPGTLPTAEDVARTIGRGLPGTSMPAYDGLLDRPQIDSMARLVLALAPPAIPRALPLELGALPADTAQSAARGQALFEGIGCAACHGRDGRGLGWKPVRERPGAEPRPTDLSTPWQFRGGSDLASVARRIATGIDGSPMPSYDEQLAPSQVWDVAAYVATLARRPAWEERDPARIRGLGVATDPLERGRYLVNAMLCPLCHTPISPDTGAYDPAYFLAGGMRVSAYPWGVWYSRNLTSDPDTGLGAWSEEAIVNAVTRGISRGGRRLDPMAMPWPWFSRLSPSDARAVAVYLMSVPPVRNAVPEPRRAPLVERAGGKLLALLGASASVDFWGGNAAAELDLREGIPAPPGRRRWAWVAGGASLAVCFGALGAGLLVRGAGSRRRRIWLGVGVAGVAGWLALATWPPLGLMTPEMAVRWLLRGSPALPAALDGRQRALAERGEYVANVAPCGLCHTPAGAFIGFYNDRTLAGGMEGRWRVYGSAHSTNLTPGQADSAAGQDDRAIERAITSGIGRDGRRMHWQAMPWDILSHWSAEDQRALAAYLRALPAVPGAVPPPRGPRPGDPPADSFYFGDTARR